MSTTKYLICIGLALLLAGKLMSSFARSNITAKNQIEDNTVLYVIDSVIYHPSGQDNTLQVSPYWKCHLKGTNVWVRVNDNREVGDSIAMIVKTYSHE